MDRSLRRAWPLRYHRRYPRMPRRVGRTARRARVSPRPRRPASSPIPRVAHSVFLGDLVDRGPATPAVLATAMGMVEAGSAICVPGNHEVKLLKALRGRNVQITHGLGESLAQLESESPEFRERVESFIDGLVSHYVLDDRRLVVAHAGMREEMQGRRRRACARSPCMERPPARPTSSGCPSGIRGPRITAGPPWWCTAIPRRRRPSGSTTRSASTQDASSAVVSPPFATRNGTWCRCRRSTPTTSRRSRSCPTMRPPYQSRRGQTRGVRRRGRARIERCPDTTRGARHDPPGERCGRARSHEPVRGRPPLADLSATDHGSHGDDRGRHLAGTPGRGVRRPSVPRGSRR